MRPTLPRDGEGSAPRRAAPVDRSEVHLSEQPDVDNGRGAIARNASVLVVLTMISRVGGLVRDFMITHFFGASGVTDVFYMAFTIPNVLRRLVAEGTLTTVVQPAYQRVRKEGGAEAAVFFSRAMLGALLLIVTGIVVVGVVGAEALVGLFASGFAKDPTKWELCVELTRYLFPVVLCMSLVGLSMALLNAHDVYAVPALAPIVLNISMITFTVVGAMTFERPILGIVVGVLVGGVVQVLVQLPALRRLGLLHGPRFAFGDPVVKETLKKFVPGLFGLAVYQLNIIVLRQLCSYLGEGSVSYYYTADRLMELAVGVFAIAIAQGAFTRMNDQAAAKNVEGLKDTWREAMILTSFVALPASLGLAAIAFPIVCVLFLHGAFTHEDAVQTSLTAMAFAPGLIAISGTRATAQVFYALEDQRTPVIISLFVLASNLALGLTLQRFGVVGLAATLSLSSFLQTGLLVLLLRRKIGDLKLETLIKPVLLQLVLSVVAVAAAYYVTLVGRWPGGLTLNNVLTLAAAIGVAVAVYGGGAVLLKLNGADTMFNKIKRKLGIKK